MKRKDIASELNLSPSIITRVLNRNERGSISDELRNQIISTAIKNGVHVKNRRYGILVGSHQCKVDDPFFGDVIQYASEAFQKMSYYKCFHCTAPELEKMSDDEITDYYGRLDGIVVITTAPKKILTRIAKLTDNIVYIGEIFAYYDSKKYDYGLPDFLFDKITYDSYSMISRCVEYLAGLGRKKIVYIGIDDGGDKYKNLRCIGFIDGLSKIGIAPEGKTFFTENVGFEGGYYTAEIINTETDFDAVVCHNDQIALGCMERLISLGKKIPEDVMVTGFYDIAGASSKGLTSVKIDTRAIGYFSADIINARAEKIINTPISIEFGLELVKRKSTGEFFSE